MPEALDEIELPFTFAVVGDAHFTRPELYPDLDRVARGTQAQDVAKYVENVDYALVPMMESLKAQAPSFVVMLGDLVEGHRDPERYATDLQAGLDFFSSYDLPLLVARGNRDGVEAFDRILYPHLSPLVGRPLEATYYYADVAGSRLILLDTAAWKTDGAQHAWLERLLKEPPGSDVGRIFVFGHHPIWPVARVFFTNPDFHRDMSELLARNPIDAFFCAHTHNQTAIAHRTEGKPVLQFMGAPIGVPEEIPTPLDRVQAILPSPDDVSVFWPGYLENTAPGWFLVRVDPRGVRVEWHHLNRGTEMVVQWHRRGDVRSFWQMAHPPDAQLIDSDLRNVRRAFLRFSCWDAMQPGRRVALNGEDVGSLPPGTRYSWRRMELPVRTLGRIRMENQVEIQASEDEASTIGNILLEAVLPGGRTVRTHPMPDVFTWSDRWDAWHFPSLRKVRPGKPIVAVLPFR
jgi:hypothetical protein